MTLHTGTKIYKPAYELLALSVDAKANMRKDFKNSLGTRLNDECISILLLIARVNIAETEARPQLLRELLMHLGTFELLMRLCNDKDLISPKIWAKSIELTQNVGSQGGGWLRSYRRVPNKAAVA